MESKGDEKESESTATPVLLNPYSHVKIQITECLRCQWQKLKKWYADDAGE
jgi:hypothetical protein